MSQVRGLLVPIILVVTGKQQSRRPWHVTEPQGPLTVAGAGLDRPRDRCGVEGVAFWGH